MTSTVKPKKYVCSWIDCEKAFTRSDHLQRHLLNHGAGNSTCPRCSLHFKRPDLLGEYEKHPPPSEIITTSLDRHMARHRQKDEEAGGEGLGTIESRKKLWRDRDGRIVSKRPHDGNATKPPTKKQATQSREQVHNMPNEDFADQTALHAEPLSPPKSMLSAESFDHMSQPLPEPDRRDFAEAVPGPDMFDFLANSSWGIQPLHASLHSQVEMPFEDPFNPDTGKLSLRTRR